MDRAKVTETKQGQMVDLPDQYHFDCDEVFVGRIGKAVILLPVDDDSKDTWDALIRSLDMFSDDFDIQRDARPPETREDL